MRRDVDSVLRAGVRVAIVAAAVGLLALLLARTAASAEPGAELAADGLLDPGTRTSAERAQTGSADPRGGTPRPLGPRGLRAAPRGTASFDPGVAAPPVQVGAPTRTRALELARSLAGRGRRARADRTGCRTRRCREPGRGALRIAAGTRAPWTVARPGAAREEGHPRRRCVARGSLCVAPGGARRRSGTRGPTARPDRGARFVPTARGAARRESSARAGRTRGLARCRAARRARRACARARPPLAGGTTRARGGAPFQRPARGGAFRADRARRGRGRGRGDCARGGSPIPRSTPRRSSIASGTR